MQEGDYRLAIYTIVDGKVVHKRELGGSSRSASRPTRISWESSKVWIKP